MTTVLAVVITAFLSLLTFVLLKRRNTPKFKIANPDDLGIEALLPVIAGLTRSALFSGNEVSVFQDADIFEAMLGDIAAASESVHLETFVWSDGALAQRVASGLSMAAARGVRVRLLIDAVGASEAKTERLAALRESGVEVAVYRRLRPWNLLKMNHRTHRKLLVVDGTVGYCFGHGVADQWYRPADGSCCWRDTGVRVCGPAVAGMQQVFFQNWMETTHCAPLERAAFPRNDEPGDADVHVVSSAPGDSFSDVALIFMLVMAAARREILLQNPYFVPDSGMIGCIKEAAKRGVRVRLMLPGGVTDSAFVARAGKYLYRELVTAGVELYEYQRTLCHQKIVVVDGYWSHIGSTNMDARSLELNAEVSVGVGSSEVAATLKKAFENDLLECRRIDAGEIAAVSWLGRCANAFCYRFHDQI